MSKEDTVVVRDFEIIEKEFDTLLDKLHRCEVENKKLRATVDYLRNENSVLRENKKYTVKLLVELLRKFEKFNL